MFKYDIYLFMYLCTYRVPTYLLYWYLSFNELYITYEVGILLYNESVIIMSTYSSNLYHSIIVIFPFSSSCKMIYVLAKLIQLPTIYVSIVS